MVLYFFFEDFLRVTYFASKARHYVVRDKMCSLAGVDGGWRWQLEGVVKGDGDDDGGELVVVV